MRTLVIDTATEACSVALFDGDQPIGHFHELIGRGHAERLLPAIAGLPGGGRADAIRVGCGPGSFTGVRVGMAAARALAFAWDADLTGFATYDLVAAAAMADWPTASDTSAGADAFLIVMEGGHGEWIVAVHAPAADHAAEAQAMPPERAINHHLPRVTGNRAAEFVARRGFGAALPLHPDARHGLRLHPAAIRPVPQPIYARAPDATPPPASTALSGHG